MVNVPCSKKGKKQPKTNKKGSTKGKTCTSFGNKSVTVKAHTACRKGKSVQVPSQTRSQKVCKKYS